MRHVLHHTQNSASLVYHDLFSIVFLYNVLVINRISYTSRAGLKAAKTFPLGIPTKKLFIFHKNL